MDPEGHDHPELNHKLSQASDAELADMIRDELETLYHPCCTARMAPLEDGGVVDTTLRVYGIPNLRIVDASVFPEITSGHTVSVLMPAVLATAHWFDDSCRRPRCTLSLKRPQISLKLL